MKPLFFLSILFLFIPNILGMDIDKSDNNSRPTTNVTELIGPMVTNISTLAKYIVKIAGNLEEIRRSAESLKPDIECLADRQSESCNDISCATLSKCTGTVLSDLLRVIYPFLEAILGEVDAEGAVIPGSLFAIVDSAEKIPGVIPTALYTKLHAENYMPKVDAVGTKLRNFRDKLPVLTKNFSEAMAMLNGVVATLNPEMLIQNMPIKSLPPMNELDNGEELSKNLTPEVDAILALPAPKVD